jgi:endonuclease/exonuclease/phosphatase family metal-dependent hydrolase
MNQSMPSLRVLSYNIHKGFSMDRRFVLQRIKQAIETTSADLVFLQEVIGENTVHSKKIQEWPMAPQLEFLADSIFPHFAYGKNAVYTEGHHGNAILGRFPILDCENIDISNNRFERRGLLHATLPLSENTGNPLHVICVHLDLFERGRSRQINRIVERIHEHVPDGSPLIIAGDFNDWRENVSESLEKELGVSEVFHDLNGSHARSFPCWFPFLPLDRIYIRGFRAKAASCFTEMPWRELSDHGALFAELEVL